MKFARFYNFPLNLYDVIDDVTDWLKKSEISYSSAQGYQNTRSQASHWIVMLGIEYLKIFKNLKIYI